eukprot:3224272-Prymnesium_polylepis.1
MVEPDLLRVSSRSPKAFHVAHSRRPSTSIPLPSQSDWFGRLALRSFIIDDARWLRGSPPAPAPAPPPAGAARAAACTAPAEGFELLDGGHPHDIDDDSDCLLYTSPSPRDAHES